MSRACLTVVCVALVALVGCRTTGSPPPPTPGAHRSEARAPELERAVSAWHEHDDIAPLRTWIERHPNGADVEVWREVVALADYEACLAREIVDVAGMHEIVRRYPDTMAARSALARLSSDALGRLRTTMPSRELVDFLDRGRAWARTEGGPLRVPETELVALHDAHAPELEDALARALLADGCRAHMAYCNWWIERRPDAPQTAAIAAARTQAWYDRGHPTWRGGAHARCAFRCASTCRKRASALEDGCWAPCYARCPTGVQREP